MVISCSASRSITTTSKVKTNKEIPKVNVIKQDTIPTNQLNNSEKKAKKEVEKIVTNTSNTINKSDNSDRVLESISQMQLMMTEMFNQSVMTRMKNDSLEWSNRQKDTALKHREEVINNLVKNSDESIRIGQAVLQQIKIAGDISIRVVFYYFGGTGLILLSIYLIKRDLKSQSKKLKPDNE